jgi:hypothetical protein
VNGEPKNERREVQISDAQFERIAKRAAELVEEKFYAQVGRSVIRRILFALGAGGSAIGAWEVFKALAEKAR